MKTTLGAITITALLALPATSFAHDYARPDRREPAGRRAVEIFERQHPRWPRTYCHTHRYPLHSDDTRRHCHNWDRESWAEARYRWTGYRGWSNYRDRDDRWHRDRYEAARYRHDWRRDRD